MTRKFFVWLHRWVGLLMTVFLIIVGLTGSLLAFNAELEKLICPQLFAAKPTPDSKQLDLATLAEMAESAEPHARVAFFSVGRVEMWRGSSRFGLSVAAPFVWRCLNNLYHNPVSTSPSSNRTCRFPASGSRTRPHAFAHDSLRPRAPNRTSPKYS